MCTPIGRAGGGSGRAEQGVPKRAGGGIPLISVGSTHLIMTGWIGRFQLSRTWICALLFLLPGHFGSACVDSLIGHDRMIFAGFSGRLPDDRPRPINRQPADPSYRLACLDPRLPA